VVLLPLSSGGGRGLLPVDGGEVVVATGMVGKAMWAAVNPRVRSEMSGSEEKIDGSDYHVRERRARAFSRVLHAATTAATRASCSRCTVAAVA
jgi:hypothetical protein